MSFRVGKIVFSGSQGMDLGSCDFPVSIAAVWDKRFAADERMPLMTSKSSTEPAGFIVNCLRRIGFVLVDLELTKV